MLNENVKKQLAEAFGPTKNKQERAELEQLLNFDSLGRDESERLFLKYAENSTKNEQARDVAYVLIDQFPALASVVFGEEDLSLLENWKVSAFYHYNNQIEKLLLEFVKNHADACPNFINKSTGAHKINVEICLAAMSNKKYCQKLEEKCVQCEKKGLARQSATGISVIIKNLAFHSHQHENDGYIAQILVKAAESCPRCLVAKEGKENEKYQTLLHYVAENVLDISEKNRVAQVKAVRDDLTSHQQKMNFDNLLSNYAPLTVALLEIEERVPEVFEVKNEDGKTLAQELGIESCATKILRNNLRTSLVNKNK